MMYSGISKKKKPPVFELTYLINVSHKESSFFYVIFHETNFLLQLNLEIQSLIVWSNQLGTVTILTGVP
jgi:hypothetical protein